MDLLNVYGTVLFTAAADTVSELVVAAVKARANLRDANLRGANLYGANLYGANLYGASLSGANLYGASLSGANLRDANLRDANLYGANLRGANLYGANLYGANLYGANLRDASLSGANLRDANLRDANLYGANLYGANLYGASLSGANLRSDFDCSRFQIVPETGSFEGWKKLYGGVIARLEIPAEAARVSSTGRKCRAEFVRVVELIDCPEGVAYSCYDNTVAYRVGEMVRPDAWDPDFREECTHGIHFFIRRIEAEQAVV